MRIANIDGLVTLFYDGSKKLFNEELNDEWWEEYRNNERTDTAWEETWNLSLPCKKYQKDRLSWQQVIVVEGVKVIPPKTFWGCKNIKRVIFANTVIRVECMAFWQCTSLVYVKLSINLQYIGCSAFEECDLSSVFIPETCIEIVSSVFSKNKNLTIFYAPKNATLGSSVLHATPLDRDYLFITSPWGYDHEEVNNKVNEWIKNMNEGSRYELHRECCSLQPSQEVIHKIIDENGLAAFKVGNKADSTPSQYLKENPFTDLTEIEIIRKYLTKMIIGEQDNFSFSE
ncbi:hypothetical protein CTEN210_02780 [Chaetoceros tenuissimus]|uniref:Uncharacterized protein n=1 Tax=Chaetoceros tenuissimus TaxID=426638 RepID=A0AAD3H102_9STRA|nr:hypothetical protein CTEN210_02780 [Chaetoceros tenuissimus]